MVVSEGVSAYLIVLPFFSYLTPFKDIWRRNGPNGLDDMARVVDDVAKPPNGKDLRIITT